MTPNDPKLSHGGGWRGLCRWAERRRRSAAQAVTAVAVGCSAWLGVDGRIGNCWCDEATIRDVS